MNVARGPDPDNLTYGADNEESRQKLRELILLVTERCQFDRSFGATKLNKILYYADFLAFAKYGKPITGSVYEKMKYGPVAFGSDAAREHLVKNGDAVYAFNSGRLKRLVPQREADVSLFSSREVKLVEDIIANIEGLSTEDLVEFSHGRAWDAVEMYQPIPYEAAFLSDRPYTREDIDRAHELINAGKWQD